MKKTLITALLAIAITLGTTHTASAQQKIGTVDMKKIFESYYKTKDAETKMNEERASIKRDLDERTEKRKLMEADITKLNDELKKPELSGAKKEAAAKDREKKIADWQEMMKDLQAFTKEQDEKIGAKTLNIRNGIVSDIKAIVNEKIKSDGYDLVFDTSGLSSNGVPMVMYAKDSYDFTKDIIEKLNATRPKGGASTPDAAKPVDAAKPAEAAKPADKKTK